MRNRHRIFFVIALAFLLVAGTGALAQQFGGVGAVLAPAANGAKVNGVTPGSPAEASGQIHAGDLIIAVAQGEESPVSLAGMKLAQVVDLIRGPINSTVRLTIVPRGRTEADAIEVRLTRTVLKLPAFPANGGRLVSVPKRTSWFPRYFRLSRILLLLLVVIPVFVIAFHLMTRDDR